MIKRKLFQDLVDHLPLMSSAKKLHFWRTKDRAEVDFILESGRQLVPIEVKYRSLKKETVPRSLRSCITKYRPAAAYVVNLDFKKQITLGQTRLFFLPYYELLTAPIGEL